jgi:hypothetical protein
MPKRSSRRSTAVCSACLLGSLSWAGLAAAEDSPASPPATAPAATSATPPPPGPVAAGATPQARPQDSVASTLAPNSVYAEGLGAAFAYSINYERMVIDQLGVRAGFSYLSIGVGENASGTSSGASATYLFFPITASYVGIRSGRNALELGGGVTLLYVSAAANGAGVAASGSGIVPFGVAMVGYRNQPVGEPGFMFRVGIEVLAAPGFGLQNPNPANIGVLPWPYLSLGASF